MYAAMILHKAGTEINEANMTKVIEAAGVKVDKAKITVVVNALNGVDIEKVLAEAIIPVAAVATTPTGEAPKAEAKAEAPKEEKKDDGAAAAGLGALFG